MPQLEAFTIGDFRLAVVITSPPWYENCYLVQHLPSKEIVIIDPGSDAADIEAGIKSLEGTPRAILLTHGHPDHIGAVHPLQAALNLPCRAHADEKTVLERAAAIAHSLMGEKIEQPASCDYFTGEPTLDLGGAPIRAIHCPGHTPGGVTYDFGAFAFTGDTLFNQGIGRTDLPGGDSAALAQSITRLLDLVTPETLLFAGHGPQWGAAEAKRWWRWMM